MKVVVTTVKKKTDAKKIALKLEKNRVAACVNIVKADSVYLWKGEIIDESEYLLLVKTVDEKEKALLRLLEEIHPYETPEILSLSMDKVSDKYLQYLHDTLL